MSNIQNIIILSSVIFNKNGKRYESRAISRSLDPLALEIRASRRTSPDIPNFRAARTLNDDMQILEQTSRRGDVATWQSAPCLLLIVPKTASEASLYAPLNL